MLKRKLLILLMLGFVIGCGKKADNLKICLIPDIVPSIKHSLLKEDKRNLKRISKNKKNNLTTTDIKKTAISEGPKIQILDKKTIKSSKVRSIIYKNYDGWEIKFLINEDNKLIISLKDKFGLDVKGNFEMCFIGDTSKYAENIALLCKDDSVPVELRVEAIKSEILNYVEKLQVGGNKFRIHIVEASDGTKKIIFGNYGLSGGFKWKKFWGTVGGATLIGAGVTLSILTGGLGTGAGIALGILGASLIGGGVGVGAYSLTTKEKDFKPKECVKQGIKGAVIAAGAAGLHIGLAVVGVGGVVGGITTGATVQGGANLIGGIIDKKPAKEILKRTVIGATAGALAGGLATTTVYSVSNICEANSVSNGFEAVADLTTGAISGCLGGLSGGIVGAALVAGGEKTQEIVEDLINNTNTNGSMETPRDSLIEKFKKNCKKYVPRATVSSTMCGIGIGGGVFVKDLAIKHVHKEFAADSTKGKEFLGRKVDDISFKNLKVTNKFDGQITVNGKVHMVEHGSGIPGIQNESDKLNGDYNLHENFHSYKDIDIKLDGDAHGNINSGSQFRPESVNGNQNVPHLVRGPQYSGKTPDLHFEGNQNVPHLVRGPQYSGKTPDLHFGGNQNCSGENFSGHMKIEGNIGFHSKTDIWKLITGKKGATKVECRLNNDPTFDLTSNKMPDIKLIPQGKHSISDIDPNNIHIHHDSKGTVITGNGNINEAGHDKFFVHESEGLHGNADFRASIGTGSNPEVKLDVLGKIDGRVDFHKNILGAKVKHHENVHSTIDFHAETHLDKLINNNGGKIFENAICNVNSVDTSNFSLRHFTADNIKPMLENYADNVIVNP